MEYIDPANSYSKLLKILKIIYSSTNILENIVSICISINTLHLFPQQNIKRSRKETRQSLKYRANRRTAPDES